MDRSTCALVTGGAGFLGSELVAQLLHAGWRVRALDNLATGTWDNLPDHANLERLQGDICDRALLPHALNGITAVFHLACLNLRYSLAHPEETHAVNATGTLRLLEAIRHCSPDLQRFLHVSSCEVYGTALTTPITESHPNFPTTPYGASKLAGEAHARAYALCYGLPVTIVRPFNIYGPRCHHEASSGEVIPKFLLRSQTALPLIVFGDGRQTRDFTHVSDTARGLIQAAASPHTLGQTLNLGSGTEISIVALARLIAPHAAIQFHPSRPGDVTRLIACTARARQWLNWQPRIPLTEGLQSLRSWYNTRQPASALLQSESIRNWVNP